MWPDSTTVDKVRTSLDDIRNNPSHSKVPVFGFQTARHYDNFPALAPTLRAMNQVGGYNVAMLPPGNHPYALFSQDSPWEITYDGVMYIEQILRCPTHGSYDLNFTDPRATLTYSMIWHHVAASIANLHHSSLAEKLGRLRRWCCTAHELHRFAGQIPHFEPITALLREQALAMLACVSSMMPSSMRTYFCQREEVRGIVVAEPRPSFFDFRDEPRPLNSHHELF